MQTRPLRYGGARILAPHTRLPSRLTVVVRFWGQGEGQRWEAVGMTAWPGRCNGQQAWWGTASVLGADSSCALQVLCLWLSNSATGHACWSGSHVQRTGRSCPCSRGTSRTIHWHLEDLSDIL